MGRKINNNFKCFKRDRHSGVLLSFLFFDRLKDCFVHVPNPINPKKIAKVALEPLTIKNIEVDPLGRKKVQAQGNIEGMVFWTKNPKPMLNRLDELGD